MGTGGLGGMAGTGGAAGAGGAGGMGGAAGTTPIEDDCHDLTDNSTNAFECVQLAGEAQPRCLNRCASNQDCRHGRNCLLTCKPATQEKDCPASKKCAPNGLCQARPNEIDDNGVDINSCDLAQKQCPGSNEACVNGQCVLKSLCVDGPPLGADGCFPQLTSYMVNAAAGFVVTGTQAGSYAYGSGQEGPNNNCQPKGRDPRLDWRIPLRPYPGQTDGVVCGPTNEVFPTWQDTNASAEGYNIDYFDPALKPSDAENNGQGDGRLDDLPGTMARQEAPQLVDWMKQWTADVSAPNACLYMGGPISPDLRSQSSPDPMTRAKRPRFVRARFRNTQVAFVLANLERGPSTSTTLHFQVNGGFRQESVVNLVTVQISAPARLVLGPVDSNRLDMIAGKAAPFFFVVDQRRLGTGQGGGPTRGQIVRVNPFGLSANGYLPIYEDYHASNGLFPIQ
jgi:hypothetical protein